MSVPSLQTAKVSLPTNLDLRMSGKESSLGTLEVLLPTLVAILKTYPVGKEGPSQILLETAKDDSSVMLCLTEDRDYYLQGHDCTSEEYANEPISETLEKIANMEEALGVPVAEVYVMSDGDTQIHIKITA